MLDDAISRSQDIYPKLGATWHVQPRAWLFPGGGKLRFRPLERVQDADKYQGQNISDACVEEAGQYADPSPIDRLNGVLRSARGVPTQLILTGNPGGAGHLWLKQRFIDPYPLGSKLIKVALPNGKTHTRVFIRSLLEQNRILMHNDPEYLDRLYLVGSPELVKAWLEGDWSAIAGAFFPEFSIAKHVIKPFDVPTHWLRFRAMDWGSSSPFSVGWYAVADGESHDLPRGCLVKYREWYGAVEGRHNEGLKMTADQVGDGIVGRSMGESYAYSVLDPSAFKEDGGPSIAERIAQRGAVFRRADNARVSQRGAMGGWDLLRSRLIGEDDTGPMLKFFSTCTDSIRTLPAMPHDPNRAEDVDTNAEDHAADEIRYACASRPYVRKSKPPPPVIRDISKMTANEAFWSKRVSNGDRI